MLPIKILIIYLLIIFLTGYPTCSFIQLNGYQFDLTTLPTQGMFRVTGAKIPAITINFCSAQFQCNNYKSFVEMKQNNGTCQIMTNSKNPLKQNYTLINMNDASKGLKINYLSYQSPTDLTTKYTTINVYCSSLSVVIQNSCKYSINNDQRYLQCNIQSNAGCPKLKLNYFWQFLSDKSIVFAILLWVIALFQLLFGYIAIRVTIFIFGTFTGAIFGIIYNAQNYEDFIYQSQGYGIAVFVICLSILMGVLFGICLLTMPKLGYMNIGLWVAVILSLLLQNSVFYLTGTLTAFYITVGVVGLLMCIISLMAFKNYIIISTAFISAFWLVRPLGFFLSSYPNQFLSGQSYLINANTQWQFYLYLISILVLTILGAVFQFCCFKKNKRQGNQNYYLQQEGTFKEKIQKLLEFQQIKNFVRNGTQQLKFFKKLIVDNDQSQQQQNNYQKQINYQKKNSSVYTNSQNQGGRKKTKLQNQMIQFNNKQRAKKNQDKQKVIQITKDKKIQKKQDKKRKKVQPEPIQLSSEQDNKKSEDQELSQDIKPNKISSKFQYQYPNLNKKK